MTSQRAQEGWLYIDNRNNPGVSEEIVSANGLPTEAARGLYESATYTCSHCHSVVVLNPSRTREREWCRGCQRPICDACGATRKQTLTCKTMEQVFDETLQAADQQAGSAQPSILLAT
jgi:hypothetical protein